MRGLLLTSVHHVLNYAALAGDFDFAMIMATEGRTVIGKGLERHVVGCNASGIPFGLVHMARPDLSDGKTAAREAAHFAKATSGMQPAMGRWLDYEKRMSSTDVTPTKWIEQWLEAGGPGLMYSAPTYFNGKVPSSMQMRRPQRLIDKIFGLKRCEVEDTKIPLWLAGSGNSLAAMRKAGWWTVIHQQPKKIRHPMVRSEGGRGVDICEELWLADSACIKAFKHGVRRGRWNQT